MNVPKYYMFYSQMYFLLCLCVVSLMPMMMVFTLSPCSPTMGRENTVARRLEGTWTINGAFSNRLSPDGLNSSAPVGQFLVTFSNDSTVLEKLLDEKCEYLEKNLMKIYLAGTVQFHHVLLGVKSQPFILTSSDGVPVVLYWQGDSPVTHLLQVAPAVLPQHDLLFLGEANTEQPFTVLERVGNNLNCQEKSE